MSGSSAFANRLVERAVGADLALDSHAIAQLSAYFELLRSWNRKINLTALPLDPPTDEAVDRLFVEPLAAARVLSDRKFPCPGSGLPGASWFDLGSGGGSPAIPMKLVFPSVRLTMVESKARKVAFLREVVRALQLDPVEVAGERFEELGDRGGTANLVTVRAVRVDAALVAAAGRLLATDATLAVFQSAPELPVLAGFMALAAAPLSRSQSSWLHLYTRR